MKKQAILSEKQYLDLFNNLPTPLKDLLLLGDNFKQKLLKFIKKYKIESEKEKMFLESVEDVLLGLITLKDEPKNIAHKLQVDLKLATQMFKDLKKDVFDKYSKEIKISRKYKISKIKSK